VLGAHSWLGVSLAGLTSTARATHDEGLFLQQAFTRPGKEWGLTPVCSTAYGGNYSTWWGVSCQLGRVWEVLLKLMIVVGPVSDVLGNLTQLRVLNLYGNQLTGAPSGHSLQIVAMSRPHRLPARGCL
jgi:hypothetical protein